MQELFQLVPAAYVVLRRERQVLLQLRQNTGFMDGNWACAAAGHVEAGESVEAAAVREAAEEMGLTLDRRDLLPLSTLHRTNVGDSPRAQRVDFFFAASRWAGEPKIMEPEKCAAIEWFDLDKLPEPMPEHERYVLENLAAGTLPAIASLGFDA
jgi:8-oxo-dGTP diphosphatase